jgi:acetylornithine deacetylase/succinyl-diaminopimelate desuccinylase-like protein
MDFRLVPRQTPEKMLDLLRAHLDARGFNDVEIVSLGGLYPAMTPLNSPIVKASLATWEELGAPNVVLSPVTGGSGPMSLMTEMLGIPTVAAGGVAYEGSRVHSPNENIKLADFKEAIRYWGRFYHRVSQL